MLHSSLSGTCRKHHIECILKTLNTFEVMSTGHVLDITGQACQLYHPSLLISFCIQGVTDYETFLQTKESHSNYKLTENMMC